MPMKDDTETRARAVRLVDRAQLRAYASEYEAIKTARPFA